MGGFGMTEKRFTIDKDGITVIDNYTDGLTECKYSQEAKLLCYFLNEITEENEQLKKDVEYWKQVASQYSNELNVFEHCKKYKTECKDIHWSSD